MAWISKSDIEKNRLFNNFSVAGKKNILISVSIDGKYSVNKVPRFPTKPNEREPNAFLIKLRESHM